MREASDGVSVDMIWGELRQRTPSPVLMYKPKGTVDPTLPLLNKEDFGLVLMTKAQRDALARWGNDVIFDKPIKVGIPYLGPWNKRLLTLGLQHGVYFAQSNRWTIRRSFPSPKVRQTAAELGGSVYEIKCQCPDGSEKLYVGQTGGPLAKRLKQHERQWKGVTGSFSAHSPAPPGADPASGHQLGLTTAKTIRAEEFYPVRVILEAMQILKLSESGAELIDNPNLRQRDGPRINKSDGVRLSPLWRPLALKL